MTRRLPSVLLATLLLTTSAALAQGTVTRGPYLQSVDEDSAIVGLRLSAACPVEVSYGPGSDLTQTASSAGPGTQHFVALEGLFAGSEYAYEVHACGAATGQGGTFQTAPARPGPVKFAAVGDFGTGGSEQRRVAQAMIAQAPEFWLALGDIAYADGTDAEFGSRFFAPMGGLLSISPVFPVLGNHEYHTQHGQPYLDVFDLPRNNPAGSERYYSFDWGPVHVVALDSNCAVGLGPVCTFEEQKAFLEQDLAHSSAPWKIVMFHHPPYSSGQHGSNKRMKELEPLLEAAGVDLVLTAHDHNYERSHPIKAGEVVAEGTPGAVVYVVSGSGGATLRGLPSPQPAWSAFRDNENYGFVTIEVNGGRLTGRFVNTAGQSVDEFVLEKDVPEEPSELQVTVEPDQGAAPLQVRFTVDSVGTEEALWRFGDGAEATGEVVTHTFTAPGLYTTAVTVLGAQGPRETTRQITVLDQDGQPGPTFPPPSGDGFDEGVGCAAAGTASLLGAPLGLLLLAWRRRRGSDRGPN
jgi:acid phosphatase type 7